MTCLEGRCIELVAECSEKWAKINANLGAVDGIIRSANLQVNFAPSQTWRSLAVGRGSSPVFCSAVGRSCARHATATRCAQAAASSCSLLCELALVPWLRSHKRYVAGPTRTVQDEAGARRTALECKVHVLSTYTRVSTRAAICTWSSQRVCLRLTLLRMHNVGRRRVLCE